MLTVISPAKTLDFESPAKTRAATDPAFLERSSELVKIMRDFSAKDLSKLMRISPKLGELNQQRFEAWQLPFTQDNAKQALLAFKGDVYIGLAAEEYSSRDFTFAQKNIRILSGLYGLLRPLDLIQPYRLEMGTKVKNANGKDLYDYWGSCIAESIEQEMSPTITRLGPLQENKLQQQNATGVDPNCLVPSDRDADSDAVAADRDRCRRDGEEIDQFLPFEYFQE